MKGQSFFLACGLKSLLLRLVRFPFGLLKTKKPLNLKWSGFFWFDKIGKFPFGRQLQAFHNSFY
jgi:hypothetical protein